MLRIGSALVLAMLAIAAPARAQDADELWNWCFGSASDDQTIKGCDAVISTKRGTADNQAGAYYNRASFDGRRPGTFFANLRDPHETQRWSMPTLATSAA